MKSQNFNLVRYDADEGMVFDWANAHFIDVQDENGTVRQEQEHLYVKTLFIGGHDSINNYIEVPALEGM